MLALSLGVLYAFVSPPFSVDDESESMARLSDLGALSLGAHTDQTGPFHSVDPELARLAAQYEPLATELAARTSVATLLHDLNAKSGAAKSVRLAGKPGRLRAISELPLLPGWWLGSLLKLPLLGQLYLARLTGVLCFSLLGGYAFVIAGRLGWALLALGAMPMTLTQSAGVSGEGFTTGMALCFFALISKGALGPTAGLSRKERLTLLALFVALVLCQPLFLVAAPCFLALRGEATPSYREGPRFFVLALAAGALALLVSSAVEGPLFDVNEVASPSAQWDLIKASPATVLFRVLRSIFKQLDELLIEFSAFRTHLSDQVRFAGGVIAALSVELILLLSWGVLADADTADASPSPSAARFWFLATFIAHASTLVLVAYLTQTQPGAPYVRGLPARALAATAPALLLALAMRGRPTLARFLSDRPTTRIVLPALLLNALCLLTLIGRYFVPADIDWPY